jgi:hypothetical protein
MFQFKKILHPLLFASVFLCSCSQTEDITVNDSKEKKPEDSKVVLRLQSNFSASTRSAEDSYVYSQGTADEYKVNSARVYFFDNMTKLLAKTAQLSGITFFGSDGSGNIVYETDPITIPNGTYDVFVIANTNRQINKDKEDQFIASIDSISYTQALIEDISGGIIMSNRASDNVATEIRKSSSSTDVNVINILLERVLARLDVAKKSEVFELTDSKGIQYATIKLDGYHIVNLPKYYYTFRHTAVLTNLVEPKWDLMTHFGNVADVNGYVIDPYFFRKTLYAAEFTNADKYFEKFAVDYNDPNRVKWSTFNAVSSTPNYKTAYCLENCALQPAQKNGYSTGVMFRAIMEPYNNVYHLNNSTGKMELITDKTRYPEVIYYFQQKFYDSAEALAAAVSSAGGSASNTYQARKFEKTDDGYRCYYKYWIRHLDNNNNTLMGVMEFAVVRNNLYRMLVTSVEDLGDGTPEIVPDTPDEGETKLKVVLNVKPWIVRNIDVEL